VITPDADARSEDEPKCYSPACKQKYNEEKEVSGTGTDVEKNIAEREMEMDMINDEIKKVKIEIKRLEDLIEKLGDEIPEMELKLLELEENERLDGNKVSGLWHELKQMKKDYRNAYDTAEGTDEMDAAKELKELYIEKEVEYNNAIKSEDQSNIAIDEQKEKISDTEDELDTATEELVDAKDLFEQLKIEMYKAKRNDQFIAIRLSSTCETLIKMSYEDGYPTNCPTYRELKATFDNTDERFSGGWIDVGHDLERQKPHMENYWRYYEQIPNWTIITVDPDAQMMQRAAVIEIAPNQVRWICTDNDILCEKPPDFDHNEMYIQYDIHIDKYCAHALVSPDMTVINTAVNQFLTQCDDGDDWRKVISLPIYDNLRVYNSGWMTDLLRSLGVE